MLMDSVQFQTNMAPASEPLVARALQQVRQFICGLHGHDALLHFEQGRMSLQCTSCGHETPGWDLRTQPRRAAADAGARLVPMPLARARRAA